MNGISPDGNPPVKWSETENILWKVKLEGDPSDGSPVISGDKIIFQSAVDTGKKSDAATSSEPAPQSAPGGRPGRGPARAPSSIYQFNVVCLDRNTGKEIWKTTVCEVVPHEGHHGDHGFASYSPVTDGKRIWADFGSRGVYCLDMDGKILWQRDLAQKTIRAGFGEGGSPALVGELLIVLVDHEGPSFIAALNKDTGKTVWKQDRDEKTSWTTPLVVQHDGQTQIVVTGRNRTRAYDPKDGTVIWECSGQTENVIPTPVAGFDMVFCTSGFRGSKLQAIKLGKTGDLTGTDAVAWEVNEGTPYVPSPLLYEDKVYVNAVNNPDIYCYNAKTGKPYYVKQNLGEMKGMYASPVGAAGRVYFVGRNGVTYVLSNSDEYKLLSVNKLDDGIDASPAIVGDRIYLRGKQNLYCIAESKAEQK
jgi:outer membrane protein assembly factor BamB